MVGKKEEIITGIFPGRMKKVVTFLFSFILFPRKNSLSEEYGKSYWCLFGIFKVYCCQAAVQIQFFWAGALCSYGTLATHNSHY